MMIQMTSLISFVELTWHYIETCCIMLRQEVWTELFFGRGVMLDLTFCRRKQDLSTSSVLTLLVRCNGFRCYGRLLSHMIIPRHLSENHNPKEKQLSTLMPQKRDLRIFLTKLLFFDIDLIKVFQLLQRLSKSLESQIHFLTMTLSSNYRPRKYKSTFLVLDAT